MVLLCPVTEKEQKLIEYKMSLVLTNQIGAYLRKMAIDEYIIYNDITNIILTFHVSFFYASLVPKY